LNVPIYSDPAMTEELDMLAREIAGAEAHGEVSGLARGVAEAWLDFAPRAPCPPSPAGRRVESRCADGRIECLWI
jgi:hypothetical protein